MGKAKRRVAAALRLIAQRLDPQAPLVEGPCRHLVRVPHQSLFARRQVWTCAVCGAECDPPLSGR